MYERFLQYKKDNPNLYYGQFLYFDATDPIFSSKKSQKILFGNYLKRHQDGLLKQTWVKREKVRKFASVEVKLVTYLNLRTKKYQKDKCGIS